MFYVYYSSIIIIITTIIYHYIYIERERACASAAALSAIRGNHLSNTTLAPFRPGPTSSDPDLIDVCSRCFGWHYLSNATCLMRPHISSCRGLSHVCYTFEERMYSTNSVRQVIPPECCLVSLSRTERRPRLLHRICGQQGHLYIFIYVCITYMYIYIYTYTDLSI